MKMILADLADGVLNKSPAGNFFVSAVGELTLYSTSRQF